MASSTELMLRAKARRRRTEAEGGTPVPTATGYAGPTPQNQYLDLPVPGNETPVKPASAWVDKEGIHPARVSADLLGAAKYGGETLDYTVDRARQGAGNVAGLPVDLLNASPTLVNLLNLLPMVDDINVGPVSQNPVGGSEWINDLTSAATMRPEYLEDFQPDVAQTVLGRVGEEAGAAAVPLAGILGAASRTTLPALRHGTPKFSPSGNVATKPANPMKRMLLEPALVDPRNFAGKELGAAVAAGGGAGIANTMVDRDTTEGQWADLGGALGGVGLASVGDILLRALGNVGGALFQKTSYIDQTVKDAVTDRMGKAAGLDTGDGPMDTQALLDTLSNPQRERPSDVIPGFQESLADATANPGVAAMEFGRQGRPDSSGKFAQRRSDNADAVDAAMRAVEPKETPGAFREALDTERAYRLRTAADDTTVAEAEFARYMEGLQPQMIPEERGGLVREGLRNSDRAAGEVEDDVWRSISGEADAAPLAEGFDRARDSLTEARKGRVSDMEYDLDIPRRLSQTADGEAAGPVDVQEFTQLRGVMTTAQRNALRGPQPDKDKAEAIGRFITEIDEYLNSGALPKQTMEQYDLARNVSRDRNERFNRPNDPLSSVLSTKEGRPDVPNSAVAGRFVKPDARFDGEIDRLLAETDLSSHAQPVRDALSDQLIEGVAKQNGNPGRIEAFLNSYTRVFDRFPDLRDEVREAAGAARQVETATSAQGAVQRDLGDPNAGIKGRSATAKYLEFSDANSELAMREVMSAKDPEAAVTELLANIDGDPRALEGARAAFWQRMRKEGQSVDNSRRSMSGSYAWDGKRLKEFLSNPGTRAVAEKLYEGNEAALSLVNKYANVLDNVDLRQRGKATGTSGTAQGVNPVLSPETLQSRFYAYMRGQVGGTYLGTSIAAVMARRAVRNAQAEAIERLTDKVLLNPDEAAILLKENNPANRAAMNRRLRLWFGNEASTFINLLDGDEEAD